MRLKKLRRLKTQRVQPQISSEPNKYYVYHFAEGTCYMITKKTVTLIRPTVTIQFWDELKEKILASSFKISITSDLDLELQSIKDRISYNHVDTPALSNIVRALKRLFNREAF